MAADQLDMEFHEAMALMDETAKKLALLRQVMQKNRWQFGGMDRPELQELAKECEDALNGWMSSIC